MKKLIIALLLVITGFKANSQGIHIDSIKVNGVTTSNIYYNDNVTVYYHFTIANYLNALGLNPQLQFRIGNSSSTGSSSSVWPTPPSALNDSNGVFTFPFFEQSTLQNTHFFVWWMQQNTPISNEVVVHINPTFTGINEHTFNKSIKEIHYYNFSGQEVVNQTGLLIKKVVYADNSTSVSKLLVQ